MVDSTAYIGLDIHSRSCTMAWMNGEGTYRGRSTFATSGQILREEVGQIKADKKALTLEEGPLAFWTARVLEGIVDRIVVCDPRENYLISRAARKDDVADAKALARLLRLGEVKKVYQPENDRRALFKQAAFKQAASHYTDLRDQQRALKQKIKARLKRVNSNGASGIFPPRRSTAKATAKAGGPPTWRSCPTSGSVRK